jgi:curved DNA-binding protein CbpA
MNFYAVLGIPRNADDEAIRRAYRILVRRYHPDLGIGSSAEKFRQVREAYETLIDPASRRPYDLSLQPAPHHFAVPIEPTVAQSWPLRKEDPSVFGRFGPGVEFSAFQDSAGYEDVLETWLRSLEEVFYERGWPW